MPSARAAVAAPNRLNRPRRVAAAAGASLLLALGCTGAAGAAAPGEIPKPPGSNPDDRGWEKVSPADKNGSDLYHGPGRVHTSPLGDRVTFMSDRAFGDASGAPLLNDYLGERTAEGWSTRNVTAPAATDPMGSVMDLRFGYRIFSRDLTRGVLMSNDSQELLRRLHRRDFVDGSSVTLTPPPVEAMGPYEGIYAAPLAVDGSDDLEHIAFESAEQYTADAPAPTIWRTHNAYEWADGEIRFVGLVPPAGEARCGEGEPSACVAAAETIFGRGANYTPASEASLGRVVSSDGSRIFFTRVQLLHPTANGAGYTGDLFVREDGVRTIQVSASQRTDCAGDPTCGGDGDPDPAPDPESGGEVMFGTASDDGAFVFFASCRRLTDDATSQCLGGGSGERWEIYRYAVDTGELTNLTHGLSSPTLEASVGIVAATEDGSRMFFVTQPGGGKSLYQWHDGTITEVGSNREEIYESNDDGLVNMQASYLSDDGRYLIWVTTDPVGDFDGTGPEQLFVYDAENDTRRCVSCPSDGSAPTGVAKLSSSFRGGSLTFRQGQPRSMDAAGTRVFFETETPLVSQDTNGLRDVYQYDVATGEHALISSGKGSAPASVGDASVDGSSVFIVTAQQLVAADGDSSRDLYVARAGGGSPEPAIVDATDCQGDTCQGSVSGGSDRRAPSSRDLRGAGNRSMSVRASVTVGSLSSSARERATRRGRLTIAVRTSRAGRIVVAARAKLGDRRVLVARASKRVGKAGSVRLVLRLSRSARARLAAGERLWLQVTASAPGAQASRTLVLSGGRAGR